MTMIKRKHISFNMMDPYQKELVEYTKQFPNFSEYVRRLIQRDYERTQPATQAQAVVSAQPETQPDAPSVVLPLPTSQPVTHEKKADPVKIDKSHLDGLI